MTTRKWERFFLGMAYYVAKASKDPSTKVGCVLTTPDNRVLSVGFNGFPRGVPDDPALYADREQKYMRVVHAEANAVLNSTGPTAGAYLYCTLAPCTTCAGIIIQAGIRKVILPHSFEEVAAVRGPSFLVSREMLLQAEVEVVYYPEYEKSA